MGEQDSRRRVAQYRLDRLAEQDGSARTDGAGDAPPSDAGAPGPAEAPRPSTTAARGAFADELVRQAMARGEFDDLPLAGKPIPGLSGRHDPDWWLKAFIEREQITGVLPEALQLRKDDAALDDRLDGEYREDGVRAAVEEFNARIVAARRQLLGGPPVVTPLRDVETEVARWRERRRGRHAAAARAAEDPRTSVGRADAPESGTGWRRLGARLRGPAHRRRGPSADGG